MMPRDQELVLLRMLVRKLLDLHDITIEDHNLVSHVGDDIALSFDEYELLTEIALEEL